MVRVGVMFRLSCLVWCRYFSRVGIEVELRVCMVVVFVVVGGIGCLVCVLVVLIGYRECFDLIVIGEGGWLV